MEIETRAHADDTLLIPRRAQRHEGPPWYTRAAVVIGAVTALAAGLRFYHLSQPRDYIFDEVYYAKDGCFDAGIPFRQCDLDNPGEQTATVHPPVGRELIAAGIGVYGNRPFGWRVTAAVFGTLSVLLVSLLALRLFGSVLWGAVAGLLLATESLNFVQSRTSMLDIFVATFVLAGFLFLVLDRRWMEWRTPETEVLSPSDAADAALFDLPADRPPSPIFRPWRLTAGIAFGAAVATKWSGGTALAGALVLALAWERTRRKRSGLDRPLWEAFRSEAFGIFLFLILVPIMVYVASYARWFTLNGFDLQGLWRLQGSMASFSLQLSAEHPYASRPWTWILMARPVAYYYKAGTPAGTAAEVLGMGSPAIFWGSLLAIPFAFLWWIRRRDWRAGLIVVGFAFQYFPWFATGRTSFLFYMTPITPFLVLAVVYALERLADVRVGPSRARVLAPLVVVAVLLAVGVFGFFFPVLTGRTISSEAWQARMWFGCAAETTCLFNWV
ncbi:phospholipid carrier-dependent glycosyltransferase [soil metagenome]